MSSPTTFNPSSQDGAAELGRRAVAAWVAKGALGVGFTVQNLGNDWWTYRLTGMGPRGLPLAWRDGAKGVG